MTKLFLFDLGKVLVDFDFTLAIKRLQKVYPIQTTRVIALFMNSGLSEDWDRGAISPEEFYSIMQKSLKLPMSLAEFVPYWNDIFTENVEMAALLEKLKVHYRLAALSNTNVWHVAHLKATYPWIAHFDPLIASCEVRLLKPEPEIYQYALRVTQTVPQDILYIDDLAANVKAAAKLGIDAIQFKTYEKLILELEERNIQI